MNEEKYYIDRDGLIALIQNISNSIIQHTSGEITFTEETDPNTQDTVKSVDSPNNFPTIKAVTDYVEGIDFKTINGQSIVGNGDIEVSTEEYSLADEDTDGLMSKEDYSALDTIKNETLPAIREDIDSILQVLDGSVDPQEIQEIIDKYNQISEFIEGLDDNDVTQVLSDLSNDISSLQDDISSIQNDISSIQGDITSLQGDIGDINQDIVSVQGDITSLQGDVGEIGQEVTYLQGDVRTINQSIEGLDRRITNLEENPAVPDNLLDHVVLTQAEYDSLQEYDEDTLYLILEDEDWGFGDDFPVILT